MKNKSLYIVNAGFLMLSMISCQKPIEGNIKDNFDNNLSGVEITIDNSNYKSTSSPEGQFSIDYAPGKFAIQFKKEGYISKTQTLEITEKTKYPLGQII